MDVDDMEKIATILFGQIIPQSDGSDDKQSIITIHDVILQDALITIRDGVGISSITHTAVKACKYDYEAVERGAHGELDMVLTLRAVHEEQKTQIMEAVEAMLSLLKHGFRVGALTAKGFGKVCVPQVKAVIYDFHNKNDVAAWLQGTEGSKCIQKIPEQADLPMDFVVDADFSLTSSLIVRDYDTDETTANGESIAAVQKKSNGDYVIPGSSVKGVLRHQAERIMRYLDKPVGKLDRLMGFSSEDNKIKQKSRFYVDEIYFNDKNDVRSVEQSRNRIDRFTGGTMDGALFTTKPVWQQPSATPSIQHFHYEIRKCQDWEAGLALFLLRELSLGRVALGGEKSIGRGTLKGVAARIDFRDKHYELDGQGNVISGSRDELIQFAQAFVALT
jgi:CRISPR/Cas system CSM-associated protein Csm3 (group 7 of RAMP superfamily)